MADNLIQHEAEFAAAVANAAAGYDEIFLQKVQHNPRLPAQRALDIYRNNTRGARVSALEQVYPVCTRILGATVFRTIAREYVDADTCGKADLNTYGEDFSQHLARLLEDGRLANDFAYLSDLAILEFKFHQAYYVEDDPAFDFAEFELDLQNPTTVHFSLSHALSLINSNYPLYQIWAGNRGQLRSDKVSAIDGVQYLVVYRRDYQPVTKPVEQSEYRLLEAIVAKVSLQQLVDECGSPVATLLPQMIAEKWIVGFEAHE